MEEVLLMLCAGALAIVSFAVGAKVGQAVVKGEKVTVLPDDPFKAIREREEKRQAKEEQERIDTIMRNIDNYDGTEHGQTDVPMKRGE